MQPAPRTVLTLLLALAAPPSAAQELQGLDLSDAPAEKPAPPQKQPPPKPAPPQKQPPPQPPAPAASPVAGPAGPIGEDEPGLDLADESRAPSPEALGSPGEVDAAQSDRVKAVQRKGFLKRGRWELGLSLPATVNDAFYQKFGGGARVAYHFHDAFALRLRGDWFSAFRTGRVREGKVAFSSQLLSSQLDRQVLLDGVWSPVYGKVAVLGSRIVHFDLFLAAGLGLAWSATSFAPRNEGPHVAGDLGGGLRFYPADWLALEGGITATFYPDQPAATVPSSMQRVVAASFAVSIFFPFGFEYRYP